MILWLELVACSAYLAFIARLFYGYVRYQQQFRSPAVHEPLSIAVISPCKGAGPDLLPNAERLLRQDYPSYTANFVVESEQDPAWAPLTALTGSYPHGRVLVAGRTARRAQKIHNLMHGVDATAEAILVFVDNDMVVSDPAWLGKLTAPLVSDQVFITTSFFRPAEADDRLVTRLVSQMALLFEMSLVVMRGWLFGGTFALRRSSYRDYEVAACWDRAIAEDVSLVPMIRRQQLAVVYVPDCVSSCRSVSGWAGFWTWMKRQCYGHRHWPVQYAATIACLTMALALLLSWPALLALSPPASGPFAAGLAGLATAIAATLTVQLFVYYPHRHGPRRRFSWHNLASLLLIPFSFAATVAAVLQHRFVWANVRYTLKGFTRVEKVEFL